MKGLYLVDIQNDFLEGGALAVPSSNEIIDFIVRKILQTNYDILIYSLDAHLLNHTSFAVNHNVEPFTMIEGEMKWAIHCVYGTYGYKMPIDIQKAINMAVERGVMLNARLKGRDSNREEYSSASNIKCPILHLLDEVEVMGLATDYCVKSTSLDLLNLKGLKRTVGLGLDVVVNLKGCRGVTAESTEIAIQEMKDNGAIILGK